MGRFSGGSPILKGVPPLVSLSLGASLPPAWGASLPQLEFAGLGASQPSAWGRHCLVGKIWGIPSGWNAEMDEGIEGRSGVTLAGSNSVGLRT